MATTAVDMKIDKSRKQPIARQIEVRTRAWTLDSDLENPATANRYRTVFDDAGRCHHASAAYRDQIFASSCRDSLKRQSTRLSKVIYGRGALRRVCELQKSTLWKPPVEGITS